jgi:prepilin-type N-terminal cleavage/methylation domain-containing protein
MQKLLSNRNNCAVEKTGRGFTLTELAIVMAVAGIIFAAIWGVASRTFENSGITSVMQQITKSVGNIRDTFSAMQAWPISGVCQGSNNWGAVGSDVTQCFDGRNLFPTEMRVVPKSPGATALNHALGGSSTGSFSVLDEPAGAGGITAGDIGVRMKLKLLTQSACVKLLMQLPLSDTTFGITAVQVVGTGTNCVLWQGPNAGLGCVSTGSLPMTISTAKSWCNGSSPTYNEIDLDFKLHN